MSRRTQWLWVLAAIGAGALGQGALAGRPIPWQRKPGLWQTTTRIATIPMPPQVTKVCIDAATQSMLQRPGPTSARKRCDPPAVKVNGSITSIDTSCKVGTSRMITHLVVDRISDTQFHEDIDTRFEPPIGHRGPMKMTNDAVWLGACPASMKPGDVVVGGRLIHRPTKR